MNMKKDKTEKEPVGIQVVFNSVVTCIKKNYPVLILFGFAFLASAALAFVRTATSGTISSYNIEDYEVGQIADVTIRANKTLPADFNNPVAVENGENVIRKGFPITEEGYEKLKRMAQSPEYIDYRAFADAVLFLMLLGALSFFLFNPACLHRKALFKECALVAVLFVLVYASAVFASKTARFSSAYSMGVVIPASFCSFIIAILFGQMDAVIFAVLQSFAVLHAGGYQLVPFLYVLATSLASSRIVCRIERRMDMVFAALLQSLLNLVFLFVFKIIFNDSFTPDSLSVFGGVAFNGFISGILVLGFLTPLEMLLNTASVFRLMDLSDLNSPTMKKMLITAGGTYNHSLMVASLAENACHQIGANSLVARVGAYYHDIGKMDQPEYFVENQTGQNKHDEINPSLSVSVIRSHVKKGVEKARALRMPKQVIDIISEHHGNAVISYFYNEAKEKDPSVNPEDYAYSGTPPSTRESAVVMLADTVEAACRTLEKPSVPRLDKFIRVLINGKIEHHQLDNCGLTFKDLDTIRESFVQILAGYYHSRIEYPDQKDPDNGTRQSDRNFAAKTDSGQKSESSAAKSVAPRQDVQEQKSSSDEKAAKPASGAKGKS